MIWQRYSSLEIIHELIKPSPKYGKISKRPRSDLIDHTLFPLKQFFVY